MGWTVNLNMMDYMMMVDPLKNGLTYFFWIMVNLLIWLYDGLWLTYMMDYMME